MAEPTNKEAAKQKDAAAIAAKQAGNNPPIQPKKK